MSEVASASANWQIPVAALFLLLRTFLGRILQQAAESAEVSTPTLGRKSASSRRFDSMKEAIV
jgi:hypothetical protein